MKTTYKTPKVNRFRRETENTTEYWWCNGRYAALYKDGHREPYYGFATADEESVLAAIHGESLSEPKPYEGLPQQCKDFLAAMRQVVRYRDYCKAVRDVNTAFLTRQKPTFKMFLVTCQSGEHDGIDMVFDVPVFDAIRDAHYHCGWYIACGSGYKSRYIYDDFWRRSLRVIHVTNVVIIGGRNDYDV